MVFILWRSKMSVSIFEQLIGKKFDRVYQSEYDGNDAIYFENENEAFVLTHTQDCCEDVYIDDLGGDLDDLIGNELNIAECVYQYGDTDYGTYTWSFIKFATIKGYVDIKFYGSSNGYYSEAASVYEIENGNIVW